MKETFKNCISSIDAGCMKLDEFVEKYGNGACWTFVNIFNNGNKTFNECSSTIKKLNLNDYINTTQIKK